MSSDPNNAGAHPGDGSGPDDRLIDAPSLPLWTGRVAAPEDAPTVPLVPPTPWFERSVPPLPEGPQIPDNAVPPESEYTPTLTPQREPQDRKEEASMAAEDPRELARRLAEEAKRRLREVPPAPGGGPANGSAEEPARSLVERAAVPNGRPLSAKEALEAAREAERREAAAARARSDRGHAADPGRAADPAQAADPGPRTPTPPTPPPARVSPQPAPILAPAQRAARPVSANRADPAAFSATAFAAIVTRVFPKASPQQALPVVNVEMFSTLWRSHRARAIHDGDFGLAAAASALIDAAERLPEGALAAGSVTLGDEDWAVWVDLSRQTVLAAARPAAVFLAG